MTGRQDGRAGLAREMAPKRQRQPPGVAAWAAAQYGHLWGAVARASFCSCSPSMDNVVDLVSPRADEAEGRPAKRQRREAAEFVDLVDDEAPLTSRSQGEGLAGGQTHAELRRNAPAVPGTTPGLPQHSARRLEAQTGACCGRSGCRRRAPGGSGGSGWRLPAARAPHPPAAPAAAPGAAPQLERPATAVPAGNEQRL